MQCSRNFQAVLIFSMSVFSCGEADSKLRRTTLEPRKDDVNNAHIEDSNVENSYRPSYLGLATAPIKSEYRVKHEWPVSVLSIGHNTASYQNYGGEPYFHHGLDIRADAGDDVLASVGGRVVNISNYGPGPAYWEVAILDDAGFLWQYHHIDRGSIPQSIWNAFQNKTKVETGTKIGEVYYWMVETFGERYHHIHLNVLSGGGAYRNPFNFLQPLADKSAPKFVDVGLLKNGFAQDPNLPIEGAYSIYATIHDLILHDKFVVPAHKITYQMDDDPRERLVWEFSDLPGEDSNTKYVENFFVPSMTCGNYECRKLTIDLGFSTEGQRWFTNVGGQHKILIHAEDQVGNRTSHEFKWDVRTKPYP